MKNVFLAVLALFVGVPLMTVDAAACRVLEVSEHGTASPWRDCNDLRKSTRQQRQRARRVQEAKTVDAAVDHLNAGRNVEAITTLYAHPDFGPKINSWALNATAVSSREHEVVLIVALATLRCEGQFERTSIGNAATADLQSANVRWAIIAMDGLAFVAHVSDRHLAEAWARDPATEDAARDKLWRLYRASRLASNDQLETLARLLRKDGRQDDALRVLALRD